MAVDGEAGSAVDDPSTTVESGLLQEFSTVPPTTSTSSIVPPTTSPQATPSLLSPSPSTATYDNVSLTASPNVSIWNTSPTASGLSSSAVMSSPPTSLFSQSSSSAGLDSTGIDISKVDDIGVLLRSVSLRTVQAFSPKVKYSLYKNHFKPDTKLKFPSRRADGNNRSCQLHYLVENPWFIYSKVEDGIFCLPCVFFASKGL